MERIFEPYQEIYLPLDITGYISYNGKKETEEDEEEKEDEDEERKHFDIKFRKS